MVLSALLLKFHLIGAVWRSWSTWARRLMRESERAILSRTLTSASGKATALTTFMNKRATKTKFTIALPSPPSSPSSRATMRPSWPTVKQAQVRRTPWRVSNTTEATHHVVLCPAQWRRSSSLSKCSQTRISHSWCVLATSKFTMRSLATF